MIILGKITHICVIRRYKLWFTPYDIPYHTIRRMIPCASGKIEKMPAS